MALSVIVIIAAHLILLAICEPIINFPFNSQLPPVARMDEPFSYTLSPYTFRSTSNSKIYYSLRDAPKWLSIDAKEGRLYGTPSNSTVPSGEIVGQTVEIIADDLSGSAAMNSTLVISRGKSPSIKIPLGSQIEKLGDFSAPSSLIYYASTPFSFSFDWNTFGFEPNMINFYASSGDSSPLPSWVTFNSDTLTFSGTTPSIESLVQPPEAFDLRLIASDIVGFSAVSIPFSIVVGSHMLSSDVPVILLNATRGKKMSYGGLRGEIKLDNKTIDPDQVEVSSDDIPGWLSLNTQTWKIEGTPKEKTDHSTNFTLNFRDSYSDWLSVNVSVNVATTLFRSTFDDMNIQAGEPVDINLEPYFWDPSDVSISMKLDPQQDWLELDGFNITGEIPNSATGKFKILLSASSKTTASKETETLNVKLLASAKASSSVSTSATSTSTSEPTDTGLRQGVSTTTILLATLLPIFIIAILAMLLVCCMLQRRRSKQGYGSNRFRAKISGPVLDTLRVNGTDPSVQEAREYRTAITPDSMIQNVGPSGYSEAETPSTPMSSSDVLRDLETPQMPPRLFMSANSNQQMSQSMSMPVTTAGNTESRQSWYTVGTMTATGTATNQRSQGSPRSHRSDTTFPESTHQLLPPPAFLSESGGSFRSGLELTIPSIDDLLNARLGELSPERSSFSDSRDPSAFYTAAPDSSRRFSASQQSSPRGTSRQFTVRHSDTSIGRRPITADGPALQEDAGPQVPERRRPSQTRVSGERWLRRHSSRGPFYYTGPWHVEESSLAKSFPTEASFASSENWRVIGSDHHQESSSLAYRELVERAPFHPARPSTAMSTAVSGLVGNGGREGARPGERASSELISPSQWGDAKTSFRGSVQSERDMLAKSASKMSPKSGDSGLKAGSRFSRLNEMDSSMWRREDSRSRKSNEGESYKAFI